MNNDTLKKQWAQEEKQAFSGWDFSHLEGRWNTAPLPWDYKSMVLDHLKPSHSLLDMGTGGGEFLLTLHHPHKKTSVTETWEPNIQLCRRRLAPLGIDVRQVFEDGLLPFYDNAFDIVINRHAAYNLAEVFRVLKPGGMFITQQVGCENNKSLVERLALTEHLYTRTSIYPTSSQKLKSTNFSCSSRAKHFRRFNSSTLAQLSITQKLSNGSFRIFRLTVILSVYAPCRRTLIQAALFSPRSTSSSLWPRV